MRAGAGLGGTAWVMAGHAPLDGVW